MLSDLQGEALIGEAFGVSILCSGFCLLLVSRLSMVIVWVRGSSQSRMVSVQYTYLRLVTKTYSWESFLMPSFVLSLSSDCLLMRTSAVSSGWSMAM